MLLPEIAAVAAAHRGVFLRPHALAAGYTDDEIRRSHSTKEWHRVRRGAYCEAVVWKAADEPERHRMRVHAALMVLHEPAVVSHQSAAVVLGLTLWGAPLDLVHVTRTDLHSPRIEGGIHHHAGALESGDELVVDGLPVTSVARTAVDVARWHGAEVGLVTADSAVARPDCSVGQLRATAARLSDWRGARAAGRVASMADPRSESAAESRFRYLWFLAGGPELDLQVEVTVGGVVIARLDALDFDGNTGHEVDGRAKYDGEAGRDVVWREKLRQDAVHRVGLAVERWVWADIERRERTAARMRAVWRGARGWRGTP
jgi:hypothetical protein